MNQWLTLPFTSWGLSAKSLPAAIDPTPSPPQTDDVPAAGEQEGTHRYRAIFISDIHLGTRGCKAEYLLDFLRHAEADRLYLVGDIIDGWALKKGFYWPQTHNDVVQKLLRKARKGTQVIYVPGNHDEAGRQFVGLSFGDCNMQRSSAHAARWKTAVGGAR